MNVELSRVTCLLKEHREKPGRAPELRAEMGRLNVLYQKGRISEEYYDGQYSMLERELEKEESGRGKKVEERISRLNREFSGNWREMYHLLDCRHKNAFWKRTVKEITVDEETHKLNGFSFF